MRKLKQWTPRCPETVKEIYDRLPKEERGNAFLEKSLNLLYEETHYKKLVDLSDSLKNLIDITKHVKPETLEEKAKYQVNFKPNKKNARRIKYVKEKLGLTDSELFSVLVLMETPSEISHIEPSVKEEKEPFEMETPKRRHFNLKAWEMKQKQVCPDCQAIPYLNERDEELHIYCTRPNWIGIGKRKGVMGDVRILVCQNKLNYLLRTMKEAQKKKPIIEIKKEKRKSPLDHFDPTKQLGVCLNPIRMRKDYSLKCAICGKDDPEKRKACNEIVEELNSSSKTFHEFMDAMTEKKKAKTDTIEWFGSPQDISIPSIKEISMETYDENHSSKTNKLAPLLL
jgi:hypothetical protein